MCTVSYIPKENGYFLCSNRDEQLTRAKALHPELREINNQQVVLPIDGKASGTWIFTIKNGITFCLLNGAFQKHERKESYSRSRGLVVMEFFNYQSINDYLVNIDLLGVEPFTLVMIDSGSELKSLVWDGKEKHIETLDPNEKYLWSSSTLYDDDIKKERSKLFENINPVNHKEIMDFHQIGMNVKSDDFSIFLKRKKVQTVSTTLVNYNESHHEMIYTDYLSGDVLNKKINKIFEYEL